MSDDKVAQEEGKMLGKDDTNLISNAIGEMHSVRQTLGIPSRPVDYGHENPVLVPDDLRQIIGNLNVLAPQQFSSHRPYIGPLIVWLKSILVNSLMLRILRKSLGRQSSLNHYIYRITVQVIDMAERLRSTETHTKNLLAENQKLIQSNSYLTRQVDKLTGDISGMKSFAPQLSESGKPQKAESSDYDLSSLWDFYYRAFEDRFRGSEAAVREKQSSYIGRVKQHLTKNSVIVDLGCGRGEWLRLLTEEGFRPVGVDKNAEMLAAASASGLELINADVFDWLTRQPAESVDMISAFHIVEHLNPNQILRLLSEIARVTRKGGLVLVETPNPENVVVGACNFWFDITHVKPIPPLTLGFIIDFLGFEQIECIRSSPPFEGANPQNPLEAPQDYAIFAKKR
jgi:O-antigen chain-terminating methyltransferase